MKGPNGSQFIMSFWVVFWEVRMCMYGFGFIYVVSWSSFYLFFLLCWDIVMYWCYPFTNLNVQVILLLILSFVESMKNYIVLIIGVNSFWEMMKICSEFLIIFIIILNIWYIEIFVLSHSHKLNDDVSSYKLIFSIL